MIKYLPIFSKDVFFLRLSSCSVGAAAVSVIAAFPAFAPDAAEVGEAAFAVADFETQNYQ